MKIFCCFLLIFGLFVFIQCNSSNSNSITFNNEKVINEILMSTIKDDSMILNSKIFNKIIFPVIYYDYCWEYKNWPPKPPNPLPKYPPPPPPFSMSLKGILRMFNDEFDITNRIKDSAFVVNQIEKHSKLKVNKKLLYVIHEMKNAHKFCSFCYPIFSKDSKLALEVYSITISGERFEKFSLFKNVNNKWVKIKSDINERGI